MAAFKSLFIEFSYVTLHDNTLFEMYGFADLLVIIASLINIFILTMDGMTMCNMKGLARSDYQPNPQSF